MAMPRSFCTLYFSIELNLLMWLIVLGQGVSQDWRWSGTITVSFPILITGLILSAVLQHWAYYALRRQVSGPAKDEGTQSTTR
jgi:hypothetical protein